MSYQYKVALAALAVGLFAAPALADGRDRVQPAGPTPLQPAMTQHCEHGHYSDGRCYIPAQQTQQRVIRQHAPLTTVRRVVQQAPATVRRSAAPTYDFSGFNGGVGAGVSGGFAGGGGGVIVLNSGGQRFSGVLSNPAARISFGRRHGGGCGGCGGH